MAFETHSHTRASDGALEPDALVRLAARRGCGALAVTDHDTLRGGVMAYKAARLLGPNIIVVPGVEVRTLWGDVLALCYSPPSSEPPREPELLRDWADSDNCILVAAHPYHPLRHSIGGRRLWEGARMGLWDAVEVWNSRGLPIFNLPALVAQRRLGLPATSGSDAHVSREVCVSPTMVPEADTIDEVLDYIRRGGAVPTTGIPGPLAYPEALAWAIARRLGVSL